MVKKLSNKFIKGVGSVMDIFPYKRYSITSYIPEDRAADMLARDWATVGQTIKKAVSRQSDNAKEQAV